MQIRIWLSKRYIAHKIASVNAAHTHCSLNSAISIGLSSKLRSTVWLSSKVVLAGVELDGGRLGAYNSLELNDFGIGRQQNDCNSTHLHLH